MTSTATNTRHKRHKHTMLAALAVALLGSTALITVTAGIASAQTVPAATDPAAADPVATDSDAIVLDTITVTGSSYETEDTGSYTTDLISVGEKDVRSVREIPQSTHVLTRERLEDAGYTSLDTALRHTPGIVVLNNDNGRSSIFQRGFEFDRLYFNGLPAPLSSIYGTQPDMAIVDHVEILRGPSGLFGGTGEPAGAVNMRLKQAADQFKATASVKAGTYDHYRGDIDVTGPLNEAGTVRGRLVGALQSEGSWIDKVNNGVGVAYGTIQTDITYQTTATLSISHMQRDITPFNGLPTFQDGTLIDLDRSTFTGADWNRFDNTVTDYIAEVEHRFDGGGHAKASARYSVRDVDFLYSWANGYAATNGDIISGGGDTADSRWLARQYEENSFSADAHISKPFELFGQEHNVIVGADVQSVASTMLQGTGSITVDQNIYNWNTVLPEPTVAYTSQTETTPDQFGVYGQLRVKPVDRLTLIGGARLSWYNSKQVNLLTNAVTNKQDVDAHFTPYAGAVVDLTDWASAYASYTEIFQPQTQTVVGGAMIDPRTGSQYEVGLKGEFFDGGVNASVAYFNMRDRNRAISDTANPGFFLAQGEVEVQGIEIEASGSPLPGLQVAAGYTYTDTQIITGGSGVFSTFTPEHQVQLWAKYAFQNIDWLDGAWIGGGVKAFSETSSGSITAPSYMVVDLAAGYEITDHLAISANIDNVLDEKYYARVGGTSVFNFYGAPRTASLRLKATF